MERNEDPRLAIYEAINGDDYDSEIDFLIDQEGLNRESFGWREYEFKESERMHWKYLKSKVKIRSKLDKIK